MTTRSCDNCLHYRPNVPWDGSGECTYYNTPATDFESCPDFTTKIPETLPEDLPLEIQDCCECKFWMEDGCFLGYTTRIIELLTGLVFRVDEDTTFGCDEFKSKQ